MRPVGRKSKFEEEQRSSTIDRKEISVEAGAAEGREGVDVGLREDEDDEEDCLGLKSGFLSLRAV